jgi:hypothetical protein
VAIGVGIGYAAFDNSDDSDEVAQLREQLEALPAELMETMMASSASRMEVLEQLKKSSNPKQAERDLANEDYMEDYVVHSENYRLWSNGAHRRPTDPATPAEIDAALNHLFSENGRVDNRVEAEQLAENWAPFNDAAIAANRPLDQQSATYIANSVADREFTTGEAENMFFEFFDAELAANGGDSEAAMLATHAALNLAENYEWKLSLAWGGITSTTTHVASIDDVTEVEDNIEDGIVDYDLRRYMGVKVQGAITDINTEDGNFYRAEHVVVVDVSNIDEPFVDGRFNEYYRIHRGNRLGDPTGNPGNSPMSNIDAAYLVGAAEALYGGRADDSMAPFRFLPYYNGNPNNLGGSSGSWSGNLRLFQKPFEWKDGDDAIMYGGAAEETTGNQVDRMMAAGLLQYANSIIPFDAHAITGGVFMSSPPLSMLYTAKQDRVDDNNNLVGSSMIAMTWYGRGLDFTEEEAQILSSCVQYEEDDCSEFRQVEPFAGKSRPQLDEGTYTRISGSCVRITKDTRFSDVAEVMSDVINRAWGTDEAFGIQPGLIVEREDGVRVPAITIKESFDKPTYANHATPSVVEEATGRKRDVRNNAVPNQAPPLNDDGEPILAANGKHIEYIGVDGPSFEIDGYAVTWDVGIKWKFQIGFSDDAGLTMYNIRLIMPPTQEFPEGEVVPYLFRVSIPNFGTSYANTNLGGLFSAIFLESHYGEHVGLVPGQNCRGIHMTLPIFRIRGLTNVNDNQRGPIYYSTYGVDGSKNDPFAESFLGAELPYNEFPLERGPVQNGIASHGVCIQETDEDHAMWHMYAAQRLRSLAVFGATISDAYNVVNRFEFLSDGKMKVAERLHGKPAIMGHGVGGAGGAMAGGDKGGFAANHLHWHVVALEPFVRKNIPGVTNRIRVSDMAPKDDTTNWFGLSFNRDHSDILNSSDEAGMRYQFDTQRHWEMEAYDSDGNDLGGLMLKSTAWGPPPIIHDGYDQPPLRFNDPDVTLREENTWKNHWWLQRNVWVRNADRTRATNSLLSSPITAGYRNGYSTFNSQPDEDIDTGSPVIYAVMKVYHSVIQEEMPVQNGFTSVELDIWPHNLLGFNPNILIRYMPKYNDYIQNAYVRGADAPPVYTSPYTSEWADTSECPGGTAAACEDLCEAGDDECSAACTQNCFVDTAEAKAFAQKMKKNQ